MKKRGQKRTLDEAIRISGYTRTTLQTIFAAAGESLRCCSLATFKRVVSAHQNRIHGNCTPITIDGETLTIEQWAARAGVSRHVLYGRKAKFGWTLEQSVRASLERPGLWWRGRKSGALPLAEAS